MKPLRICLLSPWYGGSHKRWADELKAASEHNIDIYSLPARHWKWRMHGAAVTLAEQVMSSGREYDIFLADDMMDVAVFSALVKGQGYSIPILTYFHENQICYPVSPKDTDVVQSRDMHYGYVNFTTALSSDKLLFNSQFHRDSFLGELPGFLSRFPDYNQKDMISRLEGKSVVLSLGMDLKALDNGKPEELIANDRPLILWNHRWEYDKCPGEFLQLLIDLRNRGVDFDVALLGERGANDPPELASVRNLLGNRIIQDGPVEDYQEYGRWLWQADIVPVTAIHDFFGGSVVEAIYCGCHVLLPNRLAYPEHLNSQELLYSEYSDLVEKIYHLLQSGTWRQPALPNTVVGKYDWNVAIVEYDQVFQLSAEVQ